MHKTAMFIKFKRPFKYVLFFLIAKTFFMLEGSYIKSIKQGPDATKWVPKWMDTAAHVEHYMRKSQRGK